MNSEKAFSINVLTKNSREHAEIVERDFYADDFRTFLVLREILDIFQRRMIEYYLAGETVEERNARAAEINNSISSIPNEAWMIAQRQCSEDGDCPGGEKCINGTCQEGMEERAKALEAYAQSTASEK
jgi:Cys-rich repeat protein